MVDVQAQMQQAFTHALTGVLGQVPADLGTMIRPAAQAQFGDYQFNGAMALAKKAGRPPRAMAEAIVAAMPAEHPFASMEVAGPGFINLTLNNETLLAAVRWLALDPRLGVPLQAPPQRVVVDYCGPNVAKEMHVGHLRSSVIGDSIARVLRFCGHRVIPQNHLGDWGTQFGMLIEHLLEAGWTGAGEASIGDLNTLYQQAKQRDDSDADFSRRARERVVLLQSGDEKTLAVWRALVEESKRHFNAVYALLGIELGDADIRAESFYNDQLPTVIAMLRDAGALVESQGALVTYPPGFRDREGDPMPMIVRKSDGGFLYATTDLAALHYRVTQLKADRLIYVTDARQRDHFAMVFACAAQSLGWTQRPAPAGEVALDHVAFGAVLGADRRPFKTREGGTVRLVDLLEEAVHRAAAVVAEKNPALSAGQRAEIARVIGIGAVKYADLSTDRVKDYVFDWSRMLSFDGNTAPYLINAYVRIRSIFRKAEIDPRTLDHGQLTLEEPHERRLVLAVLGLGELITSVADSLEPHRLCNYLYALASDFHAFYEHCPVLNAPQAQVRNSRLILCEIVARTLQSGLELLGIDTVEQM